MKRPKHCYPKKPAKTRISSAKHWYKKLIWLFPLMWILQFFSWRNKFRERGKKSLDLKNHFDNRVGFNHHMNSDLLGSWIKARRSPKDACVNKFLSQCPTADRLFSHIGSRLKDKADDAERHFIKYTNELEHKSKSNNNLFYLYKLFLVPLGIFTILTSIIPKGLNFYELIIMEFSNIYFITFTSFISIALGIFSSSYEIKSESIIYLLQKNKIYQT